jgi:hypothetical protein
MAREAATVGKRSAAVCKTSSLAVRTSRVERGLPRDPCGQRSTPFDFAQGVVSGAEPRRPERSFAAQPTGATERGIPPPVAGRAQC